MPDPYLKYRNKALYPDLKFGASGEAVRVLQSILAANGYFHGAILGNFKKLTRDATIYFQQTHIDANRQALEPDGWVGPKTWWALEHPSGEEQRNYHRPETVAGLPEYRVKLLKLIYQKHAAGIREIPDGSNWGDGVTQILEGIGPAPWCCYSVSWFFHEVTDEWPLGFRHGHVQTFTRELKKAGKFHSIASGYIPIPGDVFLMHYPGSSTGHTGFSTAVEDVAAKKPFVFNTAEGNAGNRFKLGSRKSTQSTLVGFGNLFGDEGIDFPKGLSGGNAFLGDGESTR